jgi:hypothetical protein
VGSVSRNRGLVRRAGSGLGLVVLAASLVVGTNLLGTREALFGSATPEARSVASSRVDAFAAVDTTGPVKTVLRSQPWWQQVARFDSAAGPGQKAFEISDGAIQWRVRWSCSQGRFVVREGAAPKPLIDAPCDGAGSAARTETVHGALRIEAAGEWTARVEQQVDVPLVEAPLPAMSAPGARSVLAGSFYRIDQVGRGRATIYRLASGRHALRLSDFYVTANVDLEIRLSTLSRPRTTRQYRSAPSRFVAPLDTTVGSMNFMLPAGVDPARYRSLVIWCPLITSAYAAATLKPASTVR